MTGKVLPGPITPMTGFTVYRFGAFVRNLKAAARVGCVLASVSVTASVRSVASAKLKIPPGRAREPSATSRAADVGPAGRTGRIKDEFAGTERDE